MQTNLAMTAQLEYRHPATDGWSSAEELGGAAAPIRSWLLEEGSLTGRLRRQCGERFRLRLLGYGRKLLEAPEAALLGCPPHRALLREIRMSCGDHTCIYAQTVIPEMTLQAHPWLGDLGERPLGEALAQCTELRRSAFGYRRLEPADPLYRRTMSPAAGADCVAWARRSVFGLGRTALLVYEVFFPEVATCAAC